MAKLTNKEKILKVASSLLRESQQNLEVSVPKCTNYGYNIRGKILYYADNGPFVIGDDNECMVFVPGSCRNPSKIPADKPNCTRGWSD